MAEAKFVRWPLICARCGGLAAEWAIPTRGSWCLQVVCHDCVDTLRAQVWVDEGVPDRSEERRAELVEFCRLLAERVFAERVRHG